MRNVKAKALRNTVQTISDEPTAYKEIKHKQKLVKVGLNADGTDKYDIIVPVQRVLDEDCARFIYQQLK